MVWTGESRVDYEERLAHSLQASMRDAVREAAGLPPVKDQPLWTDGYACREARDWFVSSYPLLGAVAAEIISAYFSSTDTMEAVSGENTLLH